MLFKWQPCLDSLWLLSFSSVVAHDGVFVLDMAAKIDATADYICKAKWGDVEFPPPFGREAYPEVRFLDDDDDVDWAWESENLDNI